MIQMIFAYLGWVALVSLIAFALYGWDKRQAAFAGRRIPEKTLHSVAVVGGWPGAIVGQQWFRHKTRKTSFQIVFWLTVALHVSVVIALAFLFYKNWPA